MISSRAIVSELIKTACPLIADSLEHHSHVWVEFGMVWMWMMERGRLRIDGGTEASKVKNTK